MQAVAVSSATLRASASPATAGDNSNETMCCLHAVSDVGVQPGSDHDFVQNSEHFRRGAHQLHAGPHVPGKLRARLATDVGRLRDGFEPLREPLDHGLYQRHLGGVVVNQRRIVDAHILGDVAHPEAREPDGEQPIDRRRDDLLFPVRARS